MQLEQAEAITISALHELLKPVKDYLETRLGKTLKERVVKYTPKWEDAIELGNLRGIIYELFLPRLLRKEILYLNVVITLELQNEKTKDWEILKDQDVILNIEESVYEEVEEKILQRLPNFINALKTKVEVSFQRL